MIKALAACAAALSLAACVAPVQRTATGDIPPARVYIKSMTQQEAGLSQVRFSRAGGLFNNEMLELSINDVVLAQVASGEHLSIWLKPGSYELSARPVHTSSTKRAALTLEVKNGGDYQVRIATEIGGLKMQLAGQ